MKGEGKIDFFSAVLMEKWGLCTGSFSIGEGHKFSPCDIFFALETILGTR